MERTMSSAGSARQSSREGRNASCPRIALLSPYNATWQEFVATLRDVDMLVASRLHSTILGFMSETPTVAISSGAKVDAVMFDLGQTDFLLQICDFTSNDVIEALDRLELRRDVVLQQIA
jgi:polysaccharide pyruvyl transferase WcaK-like protein